MSYGSGAGAGAEEMARRAAAKEAELEAKLSRARQTRESWEAGAAGERAVAAALAELEAAGWRVLHDVHWPGRPRANLDHVVVGPGGVVVVDAKNWSGTVKISNGVLRQNGYGRQQTIEAAGDAAAAVTAMLAPGHRSCVRTAVCFVQQELDASTMPSGVVLVGLSRLTDWLRQLPHVLSPEAVEAVHAYLHRELTGAGRPQLTTTADLQRAARPTPPSRRRGGRRPNPAPNGIPTDVIKLGAVVLLLVVLYVWMS